MDPLRSNDHPEQSHISLKADNEQLRKALETAEAALRELRTIVNEHDPANSDWLFRREVIREIIGRALLSSIPEVAG